MKKPILTAIAVGLSASAAMGSNINISVQQTSGSNAIGPIPAGTVVPYKVVGQLSDNVNEGLALIGLSLDFTGGPLTAANSPLGADFTCTNPMRNFVKPEGMTNPGGYGGTVIGGDLIQCGGAQNTINNTVGNASFPIGAVLTGVAQPLPHPGACGPAVILTGSLTVPPGTPDGDYFLNAFDVFANVISDGEDGTVFWATEAAGVGSACVNPAVFPACSVFSLRVTVGGCTAAAGEVWESVLTHGAVGEVGLVIPDTGLFSEPRSAIKKLVVTFSNPINPVTATPAAIGLTGRDSAGNLRDLSGIVIGTNVVAGNTKLEITFTPSLPDFSKYRVSLNGVQNACGAAVVTGAQRILTALRGNAGGNNLVINSADVGGARSLLNTDPINPANINHVRSDANNDGKITSADVGGIRSVLNRDASGIADP